jgi:hypothetical protein
MTKHYLRAAFRLLTSNLLLLLALPVTASDLTPYTASYDANIKGISATIQRTLEKTTSTEDSPEQWLLSNNASVLFTSFEEHSEFFSDGKTITAFQYRYSNALSKKRNKTILFDWANKQANTRKGKKNASLVLPEQAFDQLNYQLQLRLDLLINEKFCEKTYTIIDAGKTKEYIVRAVGEEWLETKAGKLLTLKLEQTREGKDRRTDIWLAKDWQYLIVKLQRFEDGKSDQLLTLDKAFLNGQKVQPR